MQKELQVRERKYTVSLLTILVTMAVIIHVVPLTRRVPGLEASSLAMKLDTGPVNRSPDTVPAPDNAMKLGDDGFAAAIVLNGRSVSITELSRRHTAAGRTIFRTAVLRKSGATFSVSPAFLQARTHERL